MPLRPRIRSRTVNWNLTPIYFLELEQNRKLHRKVNIPRRQTHTEQAGKFAINLAHLRKHIAGGC